MIGKLSLQNSNARRWLAGLVLGTSLVLAAGPVAAEPTAQEQMNEAHEGRAVWQDFPGFHATIAARTAGREAVGQLSVTSEGEVTLQLSDAEGMEFVERTLKSFIGHRLADDQGVTNVTFADQDTRHPLGRLLRSLDESDKSLWRVKGDVMTEVHRHHGKTRMIISISDVTRTPEGKHLPRNYAVTVWNNETGAIESTRQVASDWQRVDGVDLPVRLFAAISRGDGTRLVEEITLSDVKLGQPAK